MIDRLRRSRPHEGEPAHRGSSLIASIRHLPRPIRALSPAARRRLQASILLASTVGATTGLVVAGLHKLILDASWLPVSREDRWWITLLPLVGLLLSTMFIQLTHDRSTETTEDYVRVFHDPNARVRLRSVPFRLLASVATVSLGGSLGLEGPSIYVGAAIGDLAERRFSKVLGGEDRKMLLVAGAAAGIAAIFKAPLTGIVFALEVPYRDELARRALIPAIFAAATSYVVFAALIGTTPLFPVQAANLRLADLFGSLVVGLACGLGARVFVRLNRLVSRAARRLTFPMRPIAAGIVLAGVGAGSLAVFHRPLALGPGYEGIGQAARGQIGAGLLLALLTMKMVTTSATAAGNGVGGLFFPSVMMGAALGGAVGHILPGPSSLFAVVGIAAFLGGAYMVPLAGVAFVAETTGAPGYIIPGLLAAAVAYLVSGPGSLSHRQRAVHRIDIDTRLNVPVREVMSTEWIEVPSEATLREFATKHVMSAKARTLPVVDGGRYIGMMALSALGDVPHEAWDTTTVADVLDRDYPAVIPSTRLRDALALMRENNKDRLPVAVGDRLVGVLSTADVIRLEQILDTLREEERRGLES